VVTRILGRIRSGVLKSTKVVGKRLIKINLGGGMEGEKGRKRPIQGGSVLEVK